MEAYLQLALEGLALAGTVGGVIRWVLVKYLAEQFASKADMAALHDKVDSLDSKIDTLIAHEWRRRRKDGRREEYDPRSR